MTSDVRGFVAEMKRQGIACGAVQSMGWGDLTQLTLPGGGRVGVYQARHARPKPMRSGKPVGARRAAKAKR
ncbi:MAG: hypothetical protein ABR576_01200 [Thermoanaerobaculia bacterium]